MWGLQCPDTIVLKFNFLVYIHIMKKIMILMYWVRMIKKEANIIIRNYKVTGLHFPVFNVYWIESQGCFIL